MKYILIIILILINTHYYSFAKSEKNREQSNNVNVALIQFPETLDPIKSWNFQHFILTQCLFQTLIRIDENGSLIGDLANKWVLSNNNKTYTFHLNKYSKFQDGNNITSRDVAWSISRHFWPNSDSITASYLSKIFSISKNLNHGEIHPSITIIDKNTIQFNLRKAYPPFIYILSISSFSIIKENKSNLTFIGSGPFYAKFFNKNKIELNKNIQYSNVQPIINNITIFKLNNNNELNKLIIDNNIDILVGLPRGELENIELPKDFELKHISSLSFTHMFFNLDKNIFKNKILRKELVKLVQKPFKTEQDFSKFYKFNPSFFPKGILPISYYKTINHENIDYKNLNILKNKKLNILVQKGYLNIKMIDKFEKTFASIGVKINWQIVATDFVDEINKNQYDLLIAGYMGNFPDPDGYLDPLRNDTFLKFGNIPSENLFKELEKIRFTEDPMERLKNYSTTFKNFEEEYYFVPLFQTNISIIKRKNLNIPESRFIYESELWKVHWK
ncbi:hypothetical protein GCL60_11780 [Silvanigrella paludirubra]|uniref:Solute-binding protein family 5 domain-containing protein n=1 Tax=Silvanigrella paludirubra TaxID=2499159 RepID=A0A6N6VWN9_9BACT|nr:ABC transporter substrate-binding protein [Silvanigrella paludirubra]KAB8037847.1 hypothetical protein GCL60_11780 [Silvanigrella paludirubra]